MRVVQRKFEAAVGGKLLQTVGNKFVKDAEMVPKQVLPPEGLTVHYCERNPSKEDAPPTLLLLHGITDEAKNLAPFVVQLKKDLPNWRVLIPDLIGHGKDLERAKKEGANFEYPTPPRMLEVIMEFLKVLQVKECCVFGMSLGAALGYFLQEQQPQMVRKAILINPGLESVLSQQFIEDFQQRRKNHFCVESREDIKYFFRDLSCPHRKRNNPVPKFFLEALWQENLKRVPRGHYRALFERLLEERNKDPEWVGCEKDIAPQANRLVIWPENDYIASYEKGQAFFADSPQTTFHSVPDCGHLFHSDGKTIVDHVMPEIIEYLKQED